MTETTPAGLGILADERDGDRGEILRMLAHAYWMEIETVMNYIAGSVNPDGLRAQEVVEALEQDIGEELGHARLFARRIKDLYGTVPGSADFEPSQLFLQPAADATDLTHLVRGVIEAEKDAIAHYERLIAACDAVDLVTQDMVIGILRDEQAHLRLFEGFLRELAPDRAR